MIEEDVERSNNILLACVNSNFCEWPLVPCKIAQTYK